MDPGLMPSLGPVTVAGAIYGIRIVCHVYMTVLDRMNLFVSMIRRLTLLVYGNTVLMN